MVLQYVFGAVLLAVGAYFLRNVRTYVGQYRTVSSVDPDATPTMQPGETVTLVGRARVLEPAPTPDPRDGTDAGAEPTPVDGSTSTTGDRESANTDGVDPGPDPGLVAWRVRRRKRKRSSSSNSGTRHRWTTERAGLEVGDLEIEADAGTVRLDRDAARDLLPGGVTDWTTADPWDSAGLHLGDPDVDARIDDPRDFGPDLPVDINLGPLSTGERSRFQVNRIDDGQQVLVHGELAMGDHGLTLTSGPAASLVLSSGSVGDLTGRLRWKIAKNTLLALVLLAFAGASFGGFLEFS